MRRIGVVFATALIVTGCAKRASTDERTNPWSTVGLGSVYESKTVTRMAKPFVHQSETTTRQTLVARNASEATIKLEISDGSTRSAQDIKVALRQHEVPPPHDGSTVTKTDELCTVPAGTFDCTRTTVELRQADASRSTVIWTAKRVPVPVKSIVTNENMTITTELTSLKVAR
jgi:hypothetical protein